MNDDGGQVDKKTVHGITSLHSPISRIKQLNRSFMRRFNGIKIAFYFIYNITFAATKFTTLYHRQHLQTTNKAYCNDIITTTIQEEYD